MPELPEVEVLRRDLLARMPKPSRIRAIRFLSPKLRTPLKMPKALVGKTLLVRDIERRSKFLIFNIEGGVFISHLGMSGYWRAEKVRSEIKHDHVIIEWENGDLWVYNDPRRFGVFEFYPDLSKAKWFSHLGPEPFSDEFLASQVVDKIRRSERAIKSIIMDAKVMVGVGNIYASEALFKAGINPFKTGKRVSSERISRLLFAIRETLAKAIKGGGSSIRDYVHVGGEKGQFQNEHLVYGRSGEMCTLCSSKIQSKKIQGRSTFWCRNCQS
ncbi:MAG: DNA-formamidopyrimidine glycosylase [Bdellovibrio sp. 28-41-41]|nr:MAG: DNA-formamidopyrimidine glycosylase [Bdellovibrio sp. 28-41-41]